MARRKFFPSRINSVLYELLFSKRIHNFEIKHRTLQRVPALIFSLDGYCTWAKLRLNLQLCQQFIFSTGQSLMVVPVPSDKLWKQQSKKKERNTLTDSPDRDHFAEHALSKSIFSDDLELVIRPGLQSAYRHRCAAGWRYRNSLPFLLSFHAIPEISNVMKTLHSRLYS